MMSSLGQERFVEAVFLDRDGTLIEDADYLSDPDAVKPFPGAAEAVARLRAAGVLLFLFTNQSGVGRGYFPLSVAEACNRETERRLGLEDGFDGVCIAPETPDEPPVYRKPSPRYILETVAEMNLDPGKVWMIGDKQSDVDAGLRAGVRAARIDPAAGSCRPDSETPVFASVAAFVDWLLAVFPERVCQSRGVSATPTNHQMSDSIDLDRLCVLARLSLSEDEKAKLGPQLERIIGYVEQLSEVNVEGVEPMAHAIHMENVLRADEAVEPSNREEFLGNAPAARTGQVVVPPVIEG